MRPAQRSRVGLCLIALSLSPGAPAAAAGRPFTVSDAVQWSQILDDQENGRGQQAFFSPDRAHFFVVTRRGNLQKGVNVEELQLFGAQQTVDFVRAAVPQRPRARTIARVETRADTDGIVDPRWTTNDEIAFTSYDCRGIRQVFAVDLEGARRQLTHSATEVRAFAATAGVVVYYADEAPRDSTVIPVTDQPLHTLFDAASGYGKATGMVAEPVELYVRSRQSLVTRRLHSPAVRLLATQRLIWLAPDGRFAVTIFPAFAAPAHWARYRSFEPYAIFGYTPEKVRANPTSRDLLGTRLRYMLVDLETLRVEPLLDAPLDPFAPLGAQVLWPEGGQSVFVTSTFLPLSVSDAAEVERRRGASGVAAVDLRTGAVERSEFKSVEAQGALEVHVEENLNVRPVLHASWSGCECGKTIYDPDPAADRFALATAGEIRWSDRAGIEWRGALLYPPHYDRAAKYPLVMQTHGFSGKEFLIGGPLRITSGMAARPLATAGVLVLQIGEEHSYEAVDRLPPADAPRAVAEGYRAAVEHLVAMGLVDPLRIGLTVFSATGRPVVPLLVEHPNLLTAVNVVDAPAWGYFARVLGENLNDDLSLNTRRELSGRPTPGRIAGWIEHDPLYRLADAQVATRLEAHGPSVLLAYWEYYSLLRQARRPLEFLYFPQGSHNLVKPAERLASQGGSVDWLRFWLQGFEDPSPVKASQYARWRGLRSGASGAR